MFGRERERAAALAMAEAAKAQIEQLEARLEEAIAANEALGKRAFIIGIEREGRICKFTFMRNGELYVVETMRLISDNLPEWKAKLL